DDISFLYNRFLSGLSETDRLQFMPPHDTNYRDALRLAFQNAEVGASYLVSILRSLTEQSAGALRLDGKLTIEGNAPSYPIRFKTEAIRAGAPQSSLSNLRLGDFSGNPDGVGIAREHGDRSEEHTSELQSRENLVCRLLLEKKKIEQNEQDEQGRSGLTCAQALQA